MNGLDWLNTNSLRNYPLTDDSSKVSDDGLFTIPDTLIVDMVLCYSGNYTLPLYISGITSNATSVLIEVYANGVGIFGTFQFSPSPSAYNTDVTMTAGTLFPSATGIVTIGTTNDLGVLPYGDFTFSYGNANLLMRVYSPASAAVNWLSFTDTLDNQSVLTGYVQLTANSNLQFRAVGNDVYMDAGENLGLNTPCPAFGTPITSINGVPPDDNGNFTLIPETCVGLTTAQYGLLISDPCSQPCVGCPEIDSLTTQINSLETSMIDIRNFVNNLQAAINQATTLLNYQCQC